VGAKLTTALHSRVDLAGIERRSGDQPPLVLRYRDRDESWQASSAGNNLSHLLVPARARYMLGALENLEVSRWLAPDDENAAKALLNPSLVFQVVEKQVDDDLNLAGVSQRTLRLAPGAGDAAGFHYGSLDGEPHPFLIDGTTYQRLALELIDK
jgi:hypothetical protein